MEYRIATVDDIDILVKSRIEVLRAANKLDEQTDMSEVEEQSRKYYEKALCNGAHLAVLVTDNGKVVGTGGVSYYEVMPTYHNPSGTKAYIMNMYTRPEYRRRGIAYKTLDILVRNAIGRRTGQITLEATDMGRPLYVKYGFTQMESEMELKNE